MHPADAHGVLKRCIVTDAVFGVGDGNGNIFHPHASPKEAHQNFRIKLHAASDAGVFADGERRVQRIDPQAAHCIPKGQGKTVDGAPKVGYPSAPLASGRRRGVKLRRAADQGVREFLREANQIRHRAEIELPVGINLQHMRVAHADGGFKTDNDGSAFALIEGLMDHLHLRGGETIAETLGGFV